MTQREFSSEYGLANETSPYLLAHADNPVHWWPWCDAALAHARKSGKPILLSIGYSACHWCHVMAHESFMDPTTADVMNEHFVNIKVDREERPDLDKIYQLAHRLLTQRAGGWPLTMFLTPWDMTPFFGGTYFPPAPRHGMPAFKGLLLRVVDFLNDSSAEVLQQNAALRQALVQAESAQANSSPGTVHTAGGLEFSTLQAAREALEAAFDSTNGGFGSAPKFPHPTNLSRLLRHYAHSIQSQAPDSHALHMVRQTLEQMARGGVYDQLGGGFYRYSVDDQWTIPHFEKMLYDNGPLLRLYTDAGLLTEDPQLRDVAAGIAHWVMTEMQSPEGGYYSSIDADSEGEEGKFYVWTRESVAASLTTNENALAQLLFGLDEPANFEGKTWHLQRAESLNAIAANMGITENAAQTLARQVINKLVLAREQRVRPGRDEKILVSWNALMISAMARAATFLEDEALYESARRSRDFIYGTMWRDGRLLATYKDGTAHLNAYLDDYAFLLEAVLDLIAIDFRPQDLSWAQALADVLLAQFEDPQSGGFYFTSADHEKLLIRSKSFMDDALPNGNGVACSALLRLGHMLGESRYVDAAERALKAANAAMQQFPHAHNAMLNALEDFIAPPQMVVLRGDRAPMQQWLARASKGRSLRRSIIAIANDEPHLPGLLAQRSAGGDVTAYICSGFECQAPADSFKAFETMLSQAEIPLWERD